MAFQQYLAIPGVVDLRSTDKEDALKELTSAVCKALDIKKQKPLVDELLKREEASSTFIGQCLAIPQTKGAIKDEFAIVVGRSLVGVKYDAARGALAHIIVLVVASEDSDTGDQIRLLAELASCFKSAIVREEILTPEGQVDLLSIVASFASGFDDKNGKGPKKEDYPVLQISQQLAREVKASAIMIFADTVRDTDFLEYFKIRGKLIIITSNKNRFDESDKRIKAIIQAPSFPASRTGQIKIGVLLALSRNLIGREDIVVCVSGNSKAGILDTLVALDIGREYEFFFTAAHTILPADVKPEVFERILGLAGEIAAEGREGKPTGTIFVVGDTNTVNQYVRQLIINPFRGYSEAERNILDPSLEETIKEFSAIDGAFIITGDGIVLSAGSYLRPHLGEVESLPSGFGTRHAAAAGITACTGSFAITISQSTGMVTLFKNGAIVLTISKPVNSDKSVTQKLLE